MNNKYQCSFCKAKFSSIDQLCNHIRHFHAISVNKSDSYTCGKNGCMRTFSLFASLKRHLRKSHSQDEVINEVQLEDSSGSDHDVQNYESMDDNENNNDESVPTNENNKDESEKMDISDDVNESKIKTLDVNKAAAKFACHLSTANVTGMTQSYIMDSCDHFITSSTEYLKVKSKEFLKSNGIDCNTKASEEFLKEFDVDSPFQKLQTIDQKYKQFKQHLNLIEPVEIMLGTRVDLRHDKKNETYVPKLINETCQYIPLLEVIKLVLSNAEVKNHIFNETTEPNNNLLKGFNDGDFFKQSDFFKEHPNGIRLQLYYDDLEVTNPLGSKTIVHKLGAFYYIIENMPPSLKSVLGGIHVLLLCLTEDVKKYGFGKILKPFLDDLNLLENGHDMTLNYGETIKVYGTIAAFCSDGLAAHQVYGMLGPSAHRFCRMCKISRENLHAGDFHPKEHRTEQTFQDDVYAAINNPATSTGSGIKEDCALNKSVYFHVSNNYVFDAMHDLLEGICPYEIKLILHHYICVEKYFDVEFFNKRIAMYNFGFHERKNKPSPNFQIQSIRNTSDHKIKQKAVQTWCLTRAIPFIISDKVPEDDPFLELVILLLRIMEIVFSRNVYKTMLPLLDTLIDEHNKTFLKLFPDQHLINKHHHLTHYPDCVHKFGPLVNLWCMRFEGKHHTFKKYAAVCCNFKNIPKTMARIAQTHQCSYWSCGLIKDNRIASSNGEITRVEETLSEQFLLSKGLASSDSVFSAKHVEFNGSEFRVGSYVAISDGLLSQENLPVFGEIVEILTNIFPNTIYFTIKQNTTLWYEKKLHAYCLKTEDALLTKEIRELADFRGYSVWTNFTDEHKYISIRNLIISKS